MASNVVLNDGWKLDRTLGSGGFGIVQLWVHVQSSKKIAIKRCKWDYTQLTQRQRKRWINEVEIMKRLNHPNIVKTGYLPFKLPNVDVNLPALCMEYCKKGDLRKILNKPENCCGINEVEAIKVMTEISSAVEYLHYNNITHRDLKPENIVIQNDVNMENHVSYKLIDLGYAKELGEVSMSASIVGTLNYVAPELLWREKYSCSVDFWSLGILFYELVTGTRPFLPTMQHTMQWMKHIQNKDYNDIYAYEMEGKVVFGKDIQNPNHLSSCLKSKMVEWFRVVLQWDPHKRGKIFDASGTSHLMVFTMLQRALSKKVLYVFCMPMYKINTYEIGDSTSIKDLQLLIEKDTNIKIEHQIITDYYGVMLNEDTVPVVSEINDHILFVFRNGCCLIEDMPIPNLPAEVKNMLAQSKCQMTYEVLRNYYRHTIYFVKEEVNLFRLFIFALSISVDLLQKKFDTFNTNMEETLKHTTALTNQVNSTRLIYTNTTNYPNGMEGLQTYFHKIDKLHSAANQIKMKFLALKSANEKLRNKARDMDYAKDLSELYNNMCDVYAEFQKGNPHKTEQPLNMVKLVFAFLNTREAQLNNESLIDVTREIDKLQGELSKLKKIFNSVIVMTKLYWKEYLKIQQPDTIVPQQSNSQQFLSISRNELNRVIQSGDNVIYDNLVIRHTLDNLMSEIQKTYLKVISLD